MTEGQFSSCTSVLPRTSVFEILRSLPYLTQHPFVSPWIVRVLNCPCLVWLPPWMKDVSPVAWWLKDSQDILKLFLQLGGIRQCCVVHTKYLASRQKWRCEAPELHLAWGSPAAYISCMRQKHNITHHPDWQTPGRYVVHASCNYVIHERNPLSLLLYTPSIENSAASWSCSSHSQLQSFHLFFWHLASFLLTWKSIYLRHKETNPFAGAPHSWYSPPWPSPPLNPTIFTPVCE